jgi:hypothetical protein
MDYPYHNLSLEELAVQAWRMFPPVDDKRWQAVYKAYHSGNIRLMASIMTDDVPDTPKGRALLSAIRSKLAHL